MAFLIPPLLEIASATALTAFGWKVAEEIPNAIRAFKDDGGGQVREYDQRLLDAMKEIEQQKIENQKKQDELMMAMMNTVLRLQDTSRSSPDHKETRKQMAKEMRKIIEENMPKKKGKACFKVLQNRMQLQCNVCMEIYNTKERRPLVFPHCGHTFSQDCLKKISRKKVFKCPFCRQDKDRFENLRVNHAIMELLDPNSPQDNDEDNEREHKKYKTRNWNWSDNDDDDDDDDYKYKKHKTRNWNWSDNERDFVTEKKTMKKLEKQDNNLAVAASKRYQERRGLRCKACQNQYNRKERCPYILSVCGHTVCWDCIDRVSGRKSTECPLCHKRNGSQDDRPLNYSVYMLLEEDEDVDECYGAQAMPARKSYFEYGQECYGLYEDLTEDDYGHPYGDHDLEGTGKWKESKKKRWQEEREMEDIETAIALSLSMQDMQEPEQDERRGREGMRREREEGTGEETWEREGGRKKRRERWIEGKEEEKELGRERREGWMEERKREGVRERRREGESVRKKRWEWEGGEREGRRRGVNEWREGERVRQESWERERGERRKEGERVRQESRERERNERRREGERVRQGRRERQ
ncbi:trichohyalin isoform X2 [Penaeus vannamei]|uniref:trichohyalin isoform X2 n=1 Tax=Penaeus vannamei TaxID=6689 RepID=UPI00387F7269